jgi:hypothetical protein
MVLHACLKISSEHIFFFSMTLSSCLVTSMSAVDCIDGMKLCGGDAVIKGCQIERCSGSGLVFEGSTNKCMISNARIDNCYNGILCLEGSIVNVASSSINCCGASGVVSSHNCNILLDSVNIDGAQENIINLAEFCSIKVSHCKFQGASGGGVVVSQQSACVLHDSTISDCGGAGVESAGKFSMSATKCSRNSNGVVLLQWHVLAGWEEEGSRSVVLWLPIFDSYPETIPIHLPCEPPSHLTRVVLDLESGLITAREVHAGHCCREMRRESPALRLRAALGLPHEAQP